MGPLTRRRGWLRGALVALAILAAAAGYLAWQLSTWELGIGATDAAHRQARAEFEAALAPAECLTREAVIAAAEARSFDWRDMPAPRWCHAPGGLGNWLRVGIEPALFMSSDDENALLFGFDAAGCSVPWDFAPCD